MSNPIESRPAPTGLTTMNISTDAEFKRRIDAMRGSRGRSEFLVDLAKEGAKARYGEDWMAFADFLVATTPKKKRGS